MNTKNDPAFPVHILTVDDLTGQGRHEGIEVAEMCTRPGLTKREWMATMALQSLITNHKFGADLQRLFDPNNRVADAGDDKENPMEYTCRIAIDFSDTLLSELAKEG